MTLVCVLQINILKKYTGFCFYVSVYNLHCALNVCVTVTSYPFYRQQNSVLYHAAVETRGVGDHATGENMHYTESNNLIASCEFLAQLQMGLNIVPRHFPQTQNLLKREQTTTKTNKKHHLKNF